MENFNIGTIVLVKKELYRACEEGNTSHILWLEREIESVLCIYLGYTHVREGIIFHAQVTTDWEGDKDYDPGGIVITKSVKALVVQPYNENGRYRKSFYAPPEACGGGLPLLWRKP